MKKRIKLSLLQTLFCLLLATTTFAQITISLTPPADTTGACEANIYSLSIANASGKRIVIDASLAFSNSTASCSANSAIYLNYINSSNITNVVTYNNGRKMSFTVGSGTATISYNSFLDCALLPATQTSANINFIQSFADSSASPSSISVNNGNHVYTANDVQIPYLVDIRPGANQYANYLTPSYLYFYYQSTGQTKANIKFTFTPDGTNFCGRVSSDTAQYAIGKNGAFANIAPNTPVSINVSDTLVIRQRIETSSCITSPTICPSVNATLNWVCNNSIPANTFCSNCLGGITNTYSIISGDIPIVRIDRILPTDSLYDFSCQNDTTPLVEWKFIITNNGAGALDSVNFSLRQGSAQEGINNLSLLPAKTFSFQKNANSQCSVIVDTTMRTQWLCTSLVNDALHSARFRIKNFGERDTITVSFKTMQCAEENSALFNIPKYFNHWGFELLEGQSKCRVLASKQLNISTPGSAYLSTHVALGSYDLDQKLEFFPTVTDLSVLPDSTFGDSVTVNVKLKSIVINDYDYQLFGCSLPVNSCNLKGWFRATIFCDTNLRVQDPWRHARIAYYRSVPNDTVYLYPDYYSTNVDTTLCEPGYYNYYFNMNSNNFKVFLDSANFEYTIQSCCKTDIGKTPYQASFYVMPNPSNCFTFTYGTNHYQPPVISDPNQKWIPLSYEGDQISVHCPGCKAPGMIADRYKMERISFGLRDSDNDDRCDVGATKIIKGDSYYNQFKNYLKDNFSSYGDTLEDYLHAYFQDGDNTNGGYTYQQMLTAGDTLHFLQLNRLIPAGLDTMGLVIDTITLYIDKPVSGGNACIDCLPYGVNPNNYVTQRIVKFSGSTIQNCVVTNTTLNQFLFTFTDTVGGNLSNYFFNSTTYPFSRFFAFQHYRLKVRYRVCGNYQLQPGFSKDDVIAESDIFNEMWMTGKRQTTAAIPLMPNDTSKLHTAGFTLSNEVGYHQVDSSFSNNFLFRCETTGGRHYFFPNSGYNNSTIINTSGCDKTILVNTFTDIGNYRNRVVDTNPFEYRPPALTADTVTIAVPLGYYIKRLRISNYILYNVLFNPNFYATGWRTLTPPAITGTVKIPKSLFPTIACLSQNITPATSDSNFYWGDQFNGHTLECIITPFNCNSTVVTPPLNTVAVSYGTNPSTCLNIAACQLPETPSVNIPTIQNIQPLVTQPNLLFTLANNVPPAQQQDLCWQVTISNPQITIQTPIKSTAADFVYIAVPTNTAVPALNNWSFTPNGGTPINAVNGIIAVDSSLAANGSISGTLCAHFIACDSSVTSFRFRYGWNCNHFPILADLPNSVCGIDSVNVGFTLRGALLGNTGKIYETPYTLCDTTVIHTCFTNAQLGYAYPNQINLLNLLPGLNVVSAALVNPATSISVPLTGTQSIWQISHANMVSAGFDTGGIHLTDEACVYFKIIPECSFAGDTLLPDILISGDSYCGDSLSTLATFNNNGSYSFGGTSCMDCWSISKTINTSTVAANIGSATYTIHVCNNSATTQTTTLTDTPPSGFVQTASTLTPTVTLASLQCSTFTVTGYFTQAGSCATHYNVAKVTSPANTVWKDSVCVTVTNPCSTTDTTFRDSTFSGTGTISNKSIYVEGRFYVNNTLTLNHCSVYTKAGAQIIVTSTGVLNLNNTTIQGCDTMWRGILANSNAKLMVNNASIIKDANRGIEAKANSTVIVDSSSIVDCVTGIYTGYPNNISMYQNISLIVTGSKFALLASAFKPDYPGQPAHGAYPKAGMDVRNLIFTLGSATGKLNTFTKMSNGIIAQNCQLNVRRSSFTAMAPDYFYTEAYNGTAIVCQRDVAGDVPMATLTIIPDGTFNTVYNSYRGVYTKRAVITANYVHLLSVHTGMRCEAAPLGSKNMVNNCTITASNNGLYFIANPLAYSFVANYNKISINGVNPPGSQISPVRYGIYMSESSQPNVLYTAIGDTINLNNATYGIYTGNLKKPLLKFNQINFTGAVKGISLNHIDYASVSCNTITGSSATTGIGVLAGNSTTNSTLYCNSVNQSRYGFYFGGACPQTVFKGNEMNSHLNGLYLNNSNTYMGQQPNFGNRWNGPFNGGFGFGAVNAAPSQYWILSSFNVDPTLGLVYNPIVSPASGWFIPSTSTGTFYCQNSLVCSTPIPAPDDTMLYDRIANGTFSTDEAKAIANEFLYRQLMEDSALWINDSLYISYMAERSQEATGYLYDAKLYLRAAGSYDSAYAALIDSANMQLRSKVDSITYLKDLKPLLPNHEALIDALYYSIGYLNQTINNLNEVRAASIANDLANASLKNDYAVPTELPEQNEKYMNEIDIAVASGNNDVILQNYATIFSIAQQCPYTGGPAVEQARHDIATVNDSVFYDDDNACLLQGVYRMAQKDSVIHQINNSIIIKPNPANDKVEVIINGMDEGVCNIEVKNSLGQLVLFFQMNCKDGNKIIDVSKLTPGVYTIKIKGSTISEQIEKLIITR